jgi:hypothetical protein
VLSVAGPERHTLPHGILNLVDGGAAREAASHARSQPSTDCGTGCASDTPRRLRSPEVRAAATKPEHWAVQHLGFGRIVTSEIEAPNL